MINFSEKSFDTWLKEAQNQAKKGQLPDYIPLLQQADPEAFSVYILGLNEAKFKRGNLILTFPLMSLIKPFLLFYLLVKLGEEIVFKKVGKDSSDYPFNSLKQLQEDQGFPRNPMINSGAIMLSSLMAGETAKLRSENLRQWLNNKANCHLFLDHKMLESVQSKPNLKNQALLTELVKSNQLQNPQVTIDTYNQICCLSGTVIDLAKLGLILINSLDDQLQKYNRIVQEIMTTSGLYEASKAFQEKVNFPTKSSVSGAILSLIPHEKTVIACYSPPLDTQGNSILGLYLTEKIAQKGQ